MIDDENPFASFEPSPPPAETKTENPAKGKRGRPKGKKNAKGGPRKKAVQQQIAAQNKAAAKNESASETIKLTVANYGRLIGLSDQASQVLHQALRTIHELTKKEQRQVVDTLANLIS